MLGIKPGAAGCLASMLPLCYAAPQIYIESLALIRFLLVKARLILFTLWHLIAKITLKIVKLQNLAYGRSSKPPRKPIATLVNVSYQRNSESMVLER